MSWTDDRVAQLRKMWGEGKTAAEIARELGGVTRNAVIGKAHRLRLSNRVSPIQQNNKKPARIAEVKTVTRAAAVKAPPAVIKVRGLKFVELKEKMCRWPLGDPKDPDFLFCGCDAVPGLPYCGDHARIAYQVATRTRILRADDLDNAPAADEHEDVKEAVSA